jgi:hypothetical protein
MRLLSIVLALIFFLYFTVNGAWKVGGALTLYCVWCLWIEYRSKKREASVLTKEDEEILDTHWSQLRRPPSDI